MEPTTTTETPTIISSSSKSDKSEKQKGKRSRKSGDGSKPIKIKLTTTKNKQGGSSTHIVTGSNNGSGSNSHHHHNSNASGSEDEDEPEAAIEEHLILRLPQGEMCEKLRESVRKREIPEDVKLQMKDSRRGQFTIGGRKYDTTLVDLPTIIESQKTFDKKQFYKTADISQMLLVDDGTGPLEEQSNLNNSNNMLRTSGDPFIYQHGLTPPLKHVRKRRFRKKLSKRAIEEVEQEVERLLEVDAQAEDVQYEVFDNRELEMENESDVGTQDIDIDMSEAAESESDDDLAAAIDRDLEELDEDDRDEEDNEDEDDEEEEEEEDSEEEEDDEERGDTGEIEQKRQEISEIKQAIQRKTDNLKSAPNAMLKKRFEDELEKLKKELALKEAYLAEMNKQQEQQAEEEEE
ncbi:TAFII55 protein conserved region-domain-containing protein [Circinella umbellata]|nr:TAFII55 protein conserved region-domain-containing protein [Circinella umbellata]